MSHDRNHNGNDRFELNLDGVKFENAFWVPGSTDLVFGSVQEEDVARHELSHGVLEPGGHRVLHIDPHPDFCLTCREDAFQDGIVLRMAAAAALDAGRFHFKVDRVLARYDEGECGEPRYPAADELTAQGVEILGLWLALQRGLTPAKLGKAYHQGLDLKAFSEAVINGLNVDAFVKALDGKALQVADFAGTLSSMSIPEVNDCLEMIAETVEEHKTHPDMADRVLFRLNDFDESSGS